MEEEKTIGVLAETDDTVDTKLSRTVSVHAYERMCAALYAYRFGTISFLDLLNRFEEILDIKSDQSAFQNILSAKE